MRIEMPRALVASVLTVLFFVSAFMAMGVPAGATQRDTSRADLNVTDETVISSSQAADNVNIAANATLKVVTGGTLVCKAINNNGGTIHMDGGTILMDRTVDGSSADAVIKGSGFNFIMKNGAKIVMRGAPAANSMDFSQGGNAQLTGTYTGVIRIEDSTIEGYGGHSVNITNPWLTQIALSAWESAGGSAEVNLAMAKDANGLDTIYIKNSRFSMVGGNAGNAANGKDGGAGVAGAGGGYSDGGQISGHVGEGGYANITFAASQLEVYNNSGTAGFYGVSGNGGNAGNGGIGAGSSNWNSYGGGAGGGGYSGGNGAFYWPTSVNSKGAAVSGQAGSGGEVNIRLFADFINITNTKAAGTGGNGGKAGDGGAAPSSATYYYNGAGGGGGYTGGGGGAYYGKSGASGAVSEDVGSGGDVTWKINAEKHLYVENIEYDGKGGNGGAGGKGGDGSGSAGYYYYATGGGGGGYSGGGGGAYGANPGTGSTSGRVGSGGNVTFEAISQGETEFKDSHISVTGGAAGKGGNGGNGGSGGGGGAGMGGGGGAGYTWGTSTNGKSKVSDFVSMGGTTEVTIRGIEKLTVTGNTATAQGGTGGNSGGAGTGGSAGGGGGGIGGAGGCYGGTSPKAEVFDRAADGGDVFLTIDSKMAVVTTSNDFSNLFGGDKGDGKKAAGTGSCGGEGTGKRTIPGEVLRYIPMSLPELIEPAENALLQGPVTLKWGKAHPAWDGLQEKQVMQFQVQIDNNSDFKSPEVDEAIDASLEDYTIDGLMGGILYLRIRAIYEIGMTPWSDARTFKHNVEPVLIKEIASQSFKEDTNPGALLNLKDYFDDDLYPNELTYKVSKQVGMGTSGDPECALNITKCMEVLVKDKTFLGVDMKKKDWNGASQVEVTATDPGGLSNKSNLFTISVIPVNDAPEVQYLDGNGNVIQNSGDVQYNKEIGGFVVTEDQVAMIEFAAFLTDVDNEIGTLSVTTDSDYLTVKGSQMSVLYEKGKLGNLYIYPVNVTVSDHLSKVISLVNFSVTPVDDMPVLKTVPARTTEEDVPLTFTLTPYGGDEEDLVTSLEWTTTDGSNMVEDKNGTLVPLVRASISKAQNQAQITIAPAPDMWGIDEVTVTVKDSAGHTVSQVIRITIEEVNDAPTVLPIPEQSIPENDRMVLDLAQYVFDVDNDKGELTLWSESKWVKTRKDLKVEAFFPTGEYSASTHQAKVWARDPVGAETPCTILFHVKKKPNIDTEIPTIEVQNGKKKVISLASYASDDVTPQEQLKWSVTTSSTKYFNAMITEGNILTIEGKSPGQAEIILNVTDADGGTDSQVVTVDVTGAEVGVFGTDAQQQANMMPLIILMLVLVGMVVAVGGMKVKMKRDRIARIRAAREARKTRMAQGAAGGVSTAGTRLATRDEVTAPVPSTDPLGLGIPVQTMKGPRKPAPMCFACGTQTVASEGRFQCPKCGRVQT